ncbi:cuticle protein [Folsomia candida]|nr:cuticle protein [Folsomia candida]
MWYSLILGSVHWVGTFFQYKSIFALNHSSIHATFRPRATTRQPPTKNMKVIAVFAAVLAVSSAQILYNGAGLGLGYSALGYNGLAYNTLGYNGLTYAAAPAVHHVPAVATKTQYHAQDELGQASFGHSEPTQAHSAVRDAAGGVRGTFSYISPEGIPFTTHYTADHNGYRVASNALPVAPAVSIAGPVDTPEVSAAKIQHAAAHAAARSRTKRGVVGTPLISSPAVFRSPATFGYGYTAVAPAHVSYAAPAVTYAAAPAVTYAAAPAVTYAAAAPAVTYTTAHHAPAAVTYAAAAPALTYSAAIAPAATVVAAAPAVRAATLTKVVNTPGHAVSYRVD